jgi:hypothetical protein
MTSSAFPLADGFLVRPAGSTDRLPQAVRLSEMSGQQLILNKIDALAPAVFDKVIND